MNRYRNNLIKISIITKVEILHQESSSPGYDFTDSSHSREPRERQLVFLPRKRNVLPKFNLLGLKPTENFQPYRVGFFQPHGLGE